MLPFPKRPMMSHIYDSQKCFYLYEFGNCFTREFILAFFDSILDHFKGSPQSKNSVFIIYCKHFTKHVVPSSDRKKKKIRTKSECV